MTPTASVIIPCYNAAGTLAEQLEHLLPQVRDAGAEIVLVDNNSSDDTPQVLNEYAMDPRVTAVRASARQGASHARNVGVEHARSNRLLFCDADDVVGDGWVRELLAALDDHTVVSGTLDSSCLNSDALSTSRQSKSTVSDRSVRTTFYGLFPTVHGGNMAVRRSAWDDIGPLDESLSAIEDIEWALRAQLAGHSIGHQPTASVGYRYRTSSLALWRQGLAYGRNRPKVARMAFEALGQRPPRLAGLRSWAWLACNLHICARPDERGLLAWVAGNRVGNLIGSVEARFMVL